MMLLFLKSNTIKIVNYEAKEIKSKLSNIQFDKTIEI